MSGMFFFIKSENKLNFSSANFCTILAKAWSFYKTPTYISLIEALHAVIVTDFFYRFTKESCEVF
jgi:hypothetical protein